MERGSKPHRGYNNSYFGGFLGLNFPVIGFMLFWIFGFSDQYTLSEYWNTLFSKNQMAAVLSLSILINLPVFFLNVWGRRYENAKGILGATLFYGVLIVLFKLF